MRPYFFICSNILATVASRMQRVLAMKGKLCWSLIIFYALRHINSHFRFIYYSLMKPFLGIFFILCL